ncbi:MAG: hypothetical protein RMJ66_04165, partial [Bacteroidia bacterium]|nr:hypothetical protein [Bacteroidia bacterium]MDW8134242.1 hypothetical protein [Bacteroidia bacterium]
MSNLLSKTIPLLQEPRMYIVGRVWLPLALNWLMMALEGPFILRVISRMPEATWNLAAFGIAFTIALVVEAPIMMLLSASAALVESRQNYERLWRFATVM